MDTRLDENQTELGVFVLAVALKVLAHGNSLLPLAPSLTMRYVCATRLLDQHVKVLGNFGCEACQVTLSVQDQAEASRLHLLLHYASAAM